MAEDIRHSPLGKETYSREHIIGKFKIRKLNFYFSSHKDTSLYLAASFYCIKKNQSNVPISIIKKESVFIIKSKALMFLLIRFFLILRLKFTENFILTAFHTAIADALVLGPLHAETFVLSDKTLQKIKTYGVNAKTERLMITLAEYYITNKEPDFNWVIMPKTNISAYLGSATYMEAYESKIPGGFMEKKPEMGVVSAVRIRL